MKDTARLGTALSRRIATAMLFTASLLSLPGVAFGQSAVLEGKDAWLFPGWESHSSVDQAGITRSIDLIRSVKSLLKGRKIELFLVIAPMKAPFYQDKLLDAQKLSADVLGRYGALMGALKQADVSTVDLVAVLKNNVKGKQSAFFRTDYHWTAWAAEASAAAAAQVIKEQWKLRGQAGDGTKLGEWTNERRFGDLAANFMTEDQRKNIGREIFTVRLSAPETAKGLTDDAAMPVHVVGNSFVQPYLGFPQALSAALDRKVSLTWNPGNVGPWSTFLQYVESQDFKESPPQVIVWQFNEAQMHQGPDAKGQWEAKSIIAADNWSTRVNAALSR